MLTTARVERWIDKVLQRKEGMIGKIRMRTARMSMKYVCVRASVCACVRVCVGDCDVNVFRIFRR